ncbi:hypothetical protein HELRODRAFT_134076, partial [Helobdella robusta]|uniref:Fibrinogen C-terminal domain-containing protein n=1 Tax=Helobdella robusta TaxID=6412 RepID=T1EI32_HELRO
WIIIQQRIDGSLSFEQKWGAYKSGFGNISENFWFGLEKMHLLTTTKPTLRIEVLTTDGLWRSDHYKDFQVQSEGEGYKLHVGGYYGDSGDVITKSSAGGLDMQDMKFSTFDKDNDAWKGGECADVSASGWWFQNCYSINLNGRY